MRAPSPTLRYVRRAFGRGRFDVVRAEGDRLAEALAADPRREAEVAELALLIGAANAARHDLARAEIYLDAGLQRWSAAHPTTGAGPDERGGADTAGSSDPPGWADDPAPTGPPPPAAAEDQLAPTPAPPPPMPPPYPAPAPWRDSPFADLPPPGAPPSWPASAAVRPPDPWMAAAPSAPPPRAPTADWFELLLCEVHLRTGRTADAGDRLGHLIEPQRDMTVRFGATRALATVATLAGQHERAHHLLNTAGGLATRIPSRFRGALVERDRAVVLARQGRMNEALAVAERVLGPLVRPAAGPYQSWGRHEAAAVALALSRLSGRAGDGAAAQRLLRVADEALGSVPDPVLDAHRQLTAATVLADGDPEDIERRLGRAATVFEHTGDRPAAALVTLEHARRAHQRGLDRSAAPLYHRAVSELTACGWGVEARHAEALRTALAEGHPPTFRYGNVP